jgi:hypothetical protein
LHVHRKEKNARYQNGKEKRSSIDAMASRHHKTSVIYCKYGVRAVSRVCHAVEMDAAGQFHVVQLFWTILPDNIFCKRCIYGVVDGEKKTYVDCTVSVTAVVDTLKQ